METSSSTLIQELLTKQQQIQQQYIQLTNILKENPNHERVLEIKAKLEEFKVSYSQIQQQLQSLEYVPSISVSQVQRPQSFQVVQQSQFSQPAPQQPQEWFLWLLKHIFDVLFLKTGSRISRWEFFLAMLLLAVLPIIGWMIWIGGILGLLAGIWWLIMYVKRFHDLNKSGRHILSIIFGFGVGIVLMMFGGMLGLFLWGWSMIFMFFLGLAILIELLYFTCICFFKKWTEWENKYGSDILLRQKKFVDNHYWGRGSIFVGILAIIQIISGIITVNTLKIMAPTIEDAFTSLSSSTGVWSNMSNMNAMITINNGDEVMEINMDSSRNDPDAWTRDQSRRTALFQLQAGIVAYQSMNGRWPEVDQASEGMNTNGLIKLVTEGIMTNLPIDPNTSVEWKGVKNGDIKNGGFSYFVSTRNGNKDGGFVLMAKTETPDNSNWVMTQGATASTGNFGINNMDLRYVTPCSSVTQGSVATNEGNWGSCIYSDTSELRYVIFY